MRKVITLILSVVLLLALSYLILGKSENASHAGLSRVEIGKTLGSKSAVNTIYLLFEGDSDENSVDEKVFSNLYEGISKGLGEIFIDNKLSLEIISIGNLKNILTSGEDLKGKLLVVFEGLELDEEIRKSLHDKSLTTILYSSREGSTCVSGNQSPYLWNFGITTGMYAEGYLSYAYQRFGVLAKDLSFILYSNTEQNSHYEATYFKETAQGLGFKVLASVSVDEREADLYKVLREIVNFSPQVLLSTSSYKGTEPFIRQSYKLGFGFEMAILLSESVPEEILSDLGPVTNKIIKPSVYLDSYESEQMTSFKEKIKLPITASYYKGYVLAETIARILSQFKNDTQPINFSRSLMALDGISINGPSGGVMIHSKARGLIQPLHLGEYKDGKFSYMQYLGDMSPSEQCE